LSWDFIGDDTINVNDAFKTFQETFVDAFRFTFPEREREARGLGTALVCIGELFAKYKSKNLKLVRNRLKTRYKKEINLAKIRANDEVIRKSTNGQSTMWGIINSKRN
ncbi:hypothetical protein HHI36_011844, partial [Cryptolaemus montrouzieri]